MLPTQLHLLGSAVVGFVLGAYMRFPGFALVAIALASAYALFVGDGILNVIGNALVSLMSLQLGYGVAIVTRALLQRSR
jgi:hypothetical protein